MGAMTPTTGRIDTLIGVDLDYSPGDPVHVRVVHRESPLYQELLDLTR